MKKAIAGLILALVCVVASQTHAQETPAVQSDDALAYLSLDLDSTGGWVAKVKGGYQWKLFKDVGLQIRNPDGSLAMSREKDFTKNGAAASISLGYNFSPKFPLTVGLEFGLGPHGKLDMTTQTATGEAFSRQRIRIFTLDLTADYEFKNCSRWTPFIGATGGVAFVSNKARARFTNNAGQVSEGNYDKKRRYNLMAGARAGVRYRINECVTLSLYGSYNYLGKIPGKSFAMAGGAGAFQARTQKVTAHSLDVKAGLKISF